MAKLLKLRRGTTSQHGSFTGAEGEVTIDTSKDTAVVHDGSTAGGTPLAKEDMSNVSSSNIAGRLSNDSIATSKIAAGALPSDVTVASANLVDGTIVNADIASNAAIAGTKLENSGVTAGSYGSSSAIPIVTVDAQGLVTAASTTAIDSTTIANGTSNVAVANNGDITTTRSGTARLVVDNQGVDVTGTLDVTGQIGSGNLTISSSVPSVTFTDNNNNPDYKISANSGAFQIEDTTNSANRLIVNSDGHVDIPGNLDVGAGLDVTGDISATGTIASSNITISNDAPSLYFTEGDANPDYQLLVNGGQFRVYDVTNTANRLVVNTDGHVDVAGNLDVGAGVDVTGNITVTGTVDGVDIAAFKTAFDEAFPSGTKMLFQQTSAPTGWTKVTSGVDNKALRVVSGTAGSGGNQTFGTVFATRNITANASNTTTTGSIAVANATQGGNITVANTTAGGNVSISSVSTSGNVNSHTLSTNEMPSHNHRTYMGPKNNSNNLQGDQPGANLVYINNGGSRLGPFYSATIQSFPLSDGGGGGHSHGFTGSSHSHTGTLSGTAHNHNATFSGSAHSHGATFSGSAHNHNISVNNLDMQVQYLDVIIASKD